jgi:hypothetical protein
VPPGGARATGGVVTAKIASHFWVSWTDVAIEHARMAGKARQRAVEAPDGSPAMGKAFDGELKAALVAITAAAFAVDAWFGAVKPMIPLPPHLLAAWTKSGARPSRAARVSETLNAGFAVGPVAARWGRQLKWLYALRDGAVHHDSLFVEAAPHPSGKSNVSRENAVYTAEASVAAADLALQIVTRCIGSPRPALFDLVKWCGDRVDVREALAAKWRDALG